MTGGAVVPSLLGGITAAAAATAVAWFVRERGLRRTHPMSGGLHAEISLPHRADRNGLDR